jgi:hypothetical protein
MRSLHDETGGVIARLLWMFVIVSVLAGGVLYAYGKNQRPLAFEGTHAAAGTDAHAPTSVAFGRGATVSIATIVRNDGRLPVTLEGLALDPPDRTEPLIPESLGLGDGRTPTPSTITFSPPELEPSSAIGVVITFGVNPSLSCERVPTSATPVALPAVDLRFSSYGIESTQAVALDHGAPTITGFTRSRCEAVAS